MNRTYLSILLLSLFLAVVIGQQIGTATPEVNPPLTTYLCSKSGCQPQTQAVTLDANWRWTHKADGYTNCFSGTWDAASCPDPLTCAKNCALEGADYPGAYGIGVAGSAIKMNLISGSNVGSRTYLMKDKQSYQMLKLKNKEFSFDVDASKLPCGLNGALYLVEMDEFGGSKQFPSNKAGAAYGTGYCDAQCPRDIKFINGQANTLNWDGHNGLFGACCAEMDLWEANGISTAYTPHPCAADGFYRCNGTECSGNGQRVKAPCDQEGCDFNSYRQGAHSFYGPNKKLDTTKPMTVVTQFKTSDGTDEGDLVEITRFYVQNGKVIPNTYSVWNGLQNYNSITDQYCLEQKSLFGDNAAFRNLGGLKSMGDALGRGMVLVLSVWTDAATNMGWLDSNMPPTASANTPGVSRGNCPSTNTAAQVQAANPGASVTYSNIKWGPIGTTTNENLEQPSVPVKPSVPEKPVTPATEKPYVPVKPATPVTEKPVVPVKPTTPTKKPTTKPATPKPVAPVKPVTPTTKPSPAPSVACAANIKQTSTSGWTSGSTTYSQWAVTITAGSKPLPKPVVLRIVPPTGATISSSWTIDYDQSTGVYSLPSYSYNSEGNFEAGSSFSFGYMLTSASSATIQLSCGGASASPMIVSDPAPAAASSPKIISDPAPAYVPYAAAQEEAAADGECYVTVSTAVQATYISGDKANVQYALTFTNEGSSNVHSVQVSISAGSDTLNNFYSVTSTSSTSQGVVYEFSLWGLSSGGSISTGGFVVASANSEAPAIPSITVYKTKCN